MTSAVLSTSAAPAPRRLTRDQALLICRIARERGGLSISPHKIPLLEQRLSRRMRVTGHSDYAFYLADALRPGGEGELTSLIEALATHTTAFFRESQQFDWLRNDGLPELVSMGAGREWPLTIWSAACSTGAEMWTAAIVTDQFLQASGRSLRWQVFGSDLSTRILDRARRAIYREDEIDGLPELLRQKYLLRSTRRHGSGHVFRIVPELRKRSKLYQANLVSAPPLLESTVDVAFLRNVLIYFDAPGREAAVRNVLARVRSGGFLLTGHTESLNPIPDGLVQIAASTYRKA